MLPSALRERIQIETRDVAATALGRTDPAWSLSRVVWGRVIPLSAETIARFGQVPGESNITHTILLRGEVSVDLDETRFRIGPRIFTPQAPPQWDAQQRTTRCLVKEEL